MAQQKWNWLVTMRLQAQSLASLSELRIQHCSELWSRLQLLLRSFVLWLWCRLAAGALIQFLDWEPPDAMGAKKTKKLKTKQTNKQKMRFNILPMIDSITYLILCQIWFFLWNIMQFFMFIYYPIHS